MNLKINWKLILISFFLATVVFFSSQIIQIARSPGVVTFTIGFPYVFSHTADECQRCGYFYWSKFIFDWVIWFFVTLIFVFGIIFLRKKHQESINSK